MQRTRVVQPTRLVDASDPRTGHDLATGGQLVVAAVLAASAAPKLWKDLIRT